MQKYNEKTRSVTFRCPESLFKWIVKQGKGASTSVAIVMALQASKKKIPRIARYVKLKIQKSKKSKSNGKKI